MSDNIRGLYFEEFEIGQEIPRQYANQHNGRGEHNRLTGGG